MLTKKTTEEILHAIEEQQSIQKRNPMDSLAWKTASKALKPLFAEMDRRSKKI